MFAELSSVNILNLQINGGRLIYRGEEMFNRSSGIGFHSTEIVNKIESQYGNLLTQRDREERSIWLPQETQEVFEMMQAGHSLLIRGEIGKGKSALVYGLRTVLAHNELPYFYIDGHFKNMYEGKITAGLEWALKNNALVIWDSLDYLVAGNKVRKYSAERHYKRSTALFSAIEDFLNRGGQLIGTSHDETWFNKFADPVLTDNPTWQGILRRLNTHMVQGVFEDPQDAANFFYQSSRVDPEQAMYLANFYRSKEFNDYISQVRSKADADEVAESLKTYQMAKILILDTKGHNQAALDAMYGFFHGDTSEAELWEEITDFVLTKNRFLKQLTAQ